MSILELFAIAVALSMDALAVCITTGICLSRPTPGQYIRMPLVFGLFQFLMPVTGWLLGYSVLEYIQKWDHWVAFILLAVVGLNMIRENMSAGDAQCEVRNDPTKGWPLIVLAVATSLDALAVGFSMAMLNTQILFSALVIGIICTCISFAGMFIGTRASCFGCIRRISGLVGGVVLFIIGARILLDHGVFA